MPLVDPLAHKLGKWPPDYGIAHVNHPLKQHGMVRLEHWKDAAVSWADLPGEAKLARLFSREGTLQ